MTVVLRDVYLLWTSVSISIFHPDASGIQYSSRPRAAQKHWSVLVSLSQQKQLLMVVNDY